MSRQEVLGLAVPPLEERRRRIERVPLPTNIGALLDAAAAEVPDRSRWNFFETGEPIAYAALSERVNQLANGMAQRGDPARLACGRDAAEHPGACRSTWLALARLGRGHGADEHRLHRARDDLRHRGRRRRVADHRRGLPADAAPACAAARASLPPTTSSSSVTATRGYPALGRVRSTVSARDFVAAAAGRPRRPAEHPVHLGHDRAFPRAACCRTATG